MPIKVDKMTMEFTKCPTSVTTKSGTFTFHDQKVPRCEAEKICRSLGQVLAPITNWEDKKALQKIADQKCGMFKQRGHLYHLGINYDKCGDSEAHISFTNGVQWNQTLHESLYRFSKESISNCMTTFWMPVLSMDTKFVVYGRQGLDPSGCQEYPHKFICLQPAQVAEKKSSSESVAKLRRAERSLAGISGSEEMSAASPLQMAAFCVLALFCCFLFVVIKSLKRENHLLKKNNDSLSSEIEQWRKNEIPNKRVEQFKS